MVNHGGRESIEAFDLRFDSSGTPSLQWRGCLPMPSGQVGNSVASFADGTVLVTVLGSGAGLLAGIALAQGITGLLKMPAEITLRMGVVAVGAAVAVGFVFGLYPAVRAARLVPVEALRYE